MSATALTRTLPLHFEDVEVGASYTTHSVEMSEAEVLAYAGKWDPQPFHLDREAGAASIFGDLTASGLHTLSQTFLLYHGLGLFKGTLLGGNAMDEVRWLRPVFVGDVLAVRVTFRSKHPISRPDRGFVLVAMETFNAKGETVLSLLLSVLLKTRAGERPSTG